MNGTARLALQPFLSRVISRLSRLTTDLASRRMEGHVSAATLVMAAILAVVLLPLGTILVLALSPGDNVWPHLASTVLPGALHRTLLLMAGVGVLTLGIGCGTAWLVTMYRFPGRGVLDRLLVIPLAMPTYIVAYCYADLLDYAGPLQVGLRDAFGWASARDYWFPNVRSTGGASLVLSFVLYPYVYLAARASFVQQSVCVLEVARTLGRTSLGAFWSVALPLARPALAAGVALALMECLNDLGAVQHFGVETLTASIYATWLQRSSLTGAAQLATVLLMLAAFLFAAERWARGGARVHHTSRRYRAIPFQDIEGWRGYAACLICALPFIAGFGLPFAHLIEDALRHASLAAEPAFVRALLNSLSLAVMSATVAVVVALALVHARRVADAPLARTGVRLAGLGYAVPGTVLALGLLIPLALFDNGLDQMLRDTLGISSGLFLSGSLFALTLAYVIRFLAVGLASIAAGAERVSPNLDAAARALGETAFSATWRVHLPLLVPAAGAAALLVFVDSMKELPATLLLRPFNFETLATQVYAFAALEQFDEAAPGALAIVLAGLLPVLLLHETISGGRVGSGESWRKR